MWRRILAWILLAGFVLLIINLAVFRIYWQASLIIYLVLAVFTLFSLGKNKTKK